MSQTIVVTGAGRGLGLCLAQQHLKRGDRVFALSRTLSDTLRALETPGRLWALRCDIISTKSVEVAANEITGEAGRVDILYNCAGVWRPEDRVSLAKTDLDRCADMFDINAVGALRVSKALLPMLQKGAVIANISSEAGSIGGCRREMEYSYCMSKAAMNMGARLLQNELAPRGVRVLCLHPGWVRTDMGGDAARKSARGIEPEDSASAIVSLAVGAHGLPPEQMFLTYSGQPLPW